MESFLQPKNIYIGDEAKLFIKLSDVTIDEKVFTESSARHITDETKNFSITEIDIVPFHNVQYLCVSFQAWNIGTLEFPNLTEFGILSKLPSVEVQKLLNENESLILREDSEAKLIPGTTAFIISFLFICFALCAAVFYSGFKYFHRSKNKKAIIKKFEREIKKIFKQKSTMLIADCTDKSIRKFLLQFFDCFEIKTVYALTYSEIIFQITKIEDIHETAKPLKTIFKQLEFSRFGNKELDTKKLLSSLNSFFDSCHELCKNKKEKRNR